MMTELLDYGDFYFLLYSVLFNFLQLGRIIYIQEKIHSRTKREKERCTQPSTKQ